MNMKNSGKKNERVTFKAVRCASIGQFVAASRYATFRKASDSPLVKVIERAEQTFASGNGVVLTLDQLLDPTHAAPNKF